MPKIDSTPKDSKRARQKGEKMMDLPASKLSIPADAGGHRQRHGAHGTIDKHMHLHTFAHNCTRN